MKSQFSGVVLFLFMAWASLSYAQSDANVMYGLKMVDGQFYLAELDLNDGIVSLISNSPVASTISNASSALNTIAGTYLFSSQNAIREIDLANGNISNLYANNDLYYFNYSCTDEQLFGLRNIDSQFYLSGFDSDSQESNIISNSATSTYLVNGWSCLDQINGHFYYAKPGFLVQVDVDSGVVLDTFPVEGITGMDFNCLDGKLYGLQQIDSSFYLISFDPSNGEFEVLSSDPVAGTVTNMWLTLNPVRNSLLFSSSGAIRELSLNTGQVMSTIWDNDLHFLKFALCCDEGPHLPSSIEVPNVFTPNGDGINDEFKLKSYNAISSFSIKVLNSWGQEVFSSEDPNFTWDAGNSKLKTGTYFWIAKFSGQSGEQEQSGTLQLKR